MEGSSNQASASLEESSTQISSDILRHINYAVNILSCLASRVWCNLGFADMKLHLNRVCFISGLQFIGHWVCYRLDGTLGPWCKLRTL